MKLSKSVQRRLIAQGADVGKLFQLVAEWEELARSYMDAHVEEWNSVDAARKKAEFSRIAGAYEYCAESLERVLNGEAGEERGNRLG